MATVAPSDPVVLCQVYFYDSRAFAHPVEGMASSPKQRPPARAARSPMLSMDLAEERAESVRQGYLVATQSKLLQLI